MTKLVASSLADAVRSKDIAEVQNMLDNPLIDSNLILPGGGTALGLASAIVGRDECSTSMTIMRHLIDCRRVNVNAVQSHQQAYTRHRFPDDEMVPLFYLLLCVPDDHDCRQMAVQIVRLLLERDDLDLQWSGMDASTSVTMRFALFPMIRGDVQAFENIRKNQGVDESYMWDCWAPLYQPATDWTLASLLLTIYPHFARRYICLSYDRTMLTPILLNGVIGGSRCSGCCRHEKCAKQQRFVEEFMKLPGIDVNQRSTPFGLTPLGYTCSEVQARLLLKFEDIDLHRMEP